MNYSSPPNSRPTVLQLVKSINIEHSTTILEKSIKMKEEMVSPRSGSSLSEFSEQSFWDRSYASNSLETLNIPRSRITSISLPQEEFINRPDVSDSKSAISVINKAQKRPANQTNDHEFLYIESKKARIEREKAEKRQRYEEQLEFDDSDLALASAPGKHFDPRNQSLDIEDLRPQAIVKKRKKIQVPDEEKDEKYWKMREKNNAATKLAREAKRLKENQIVVRTAFLEKDNQRMKIMLENLKVEHTKLCMERDGVKKQLGN